MNSEDEALLKKYCPVVYLHSKEPVKPDRVENFLAQSTASNAAYTTVTPEGSVDDVPFYGKVDRSPDGKTSLLYVFMYCYNAPYEILGCFPTGDHVADIEHVRVHLGTDNKVVAVTFGQHSNEVTIQTPLLKFYGPNRPMVFSAKGSHASYPSSGVKLRWNTGLFACDFCDYGHRWNESATVRPWPEGLPDKIGDCQNPCKQWWYAIYTQVTS
jgi:hypothetical protein